MVKNYLIQNQWKKYPADSESQSEQQSRPVPNIFWCENKPEYKKLYPDCCFNHKIALPLHPRTNQPSPIAPFQVDVKERWDLHNWFILNKAKKIGITEIILRIIAFWCFNKYAPGEVMLVAGNREWHAIDMMNRFQDLFKPLANRIADKSVKSIKLDNGITINAFPSNAEAFVGRPKVRCIYLDEAAYTAINDDSSIFENLFANISGTNGDFMIASTPNGPQGFFYSICQKPPEGWYYKEYDYLHGLQAMILDADVVSKAKANPTLQFDQLYGCKFLAAESAVVPYDFIQQAKEEYELK